MADPTKPLPDQSNEEPAVDPIADAIRRRDVPATFSTVDEIAEHLKRKAASDEEEQGAR